MTTRRRDPRAGVHVQGGVAMTKPWRSATCTRDEHLRCFAATTYSDGRVRRCRCACHLPCPNPRSHDAYDAMREAIDAARPMAACPCEDNPRWHLLGGDPYPCLRITLKRAIATVDALAAAEGKVKDR